jgi:capsular exopolysaccharide synthesis family protein
MDKQQQIQMQPRLRPPVPRAAQVMPMLTPKDIVTILRRHLWMIIILTCVGIIGGGVTWYLLRRYAPKYVARGYIRVLYPVEADPMRIGSPIVGKDIQYGRRVYIAQLLARQSMLSELLTRDKIKETNWFKSFGSDTNRGLRRRKAFEDIEDNLHASASRDAEFVIVSMTCGNARESADIVNEMMVLFINSQRDSAVSGVRDKLVELEKRRNSLERELDLAERSMDAIRATTGLTDLEQTSFRDTIELRLDVLDIEEQQLKLEISQFEANIGNLERIVEDPIGDQVENIIERDPTMVMLTQQLFSSETALAQAQTQFGENHRVIRELKERIEDLRDRRNLRKQEIGEQTRKANLADARDTLVVLSRRLEGAEMQIREARANKERLDLARVEYGKRLRIREQLQNQLNGIKNLIEQRRIQAEDPETPKVMIVGMAPVPVQMSSPKWTVYFPGGTMIGFMCSVGLAFLLELLNDLLRTPRDVVRYINIPLLGVVPHASEDHELRDVDLCHVVRLAPYSIVSEAYRQLQVNLKLSKAPNEAKVIFISSCGAGEGKTAVAINLATTLVGQGKKVLLIDANFWRSMLHKAFSKDGLDRPCDEKLKSDFGLSNLLAGEATAEMVIRPSGIEQFDVIDSGPAPSNPTQALGSENMSRLITENRENYDHIIIDGPPVLLVTGAKILASLADGTILVFNADLTRRGAAQRAVRELRVVNVTVIGCVLMGTRVLKGGYFYEQYRSYQRYQQPMLAS